MCCIKKKTNSRKNIRNGNMFEFRPCFKKFYMYDKKGKMAKKETEIAWDKEKRRKGDHVKRRNRDRRNDIRIHAKCDVSSKVREWSWDIGTYIGQNKKEFHKDIAWRQGKGRDDALWFNKR